MISARSSAPPIRTSHARVEELEDGDSRRMVLNVHARDRLLRMLDGLPHGVLSMSRDVAGLVETSNNLAVVKTETTTRRSTFRTVIDHAGALRSRAARWIDLPPGRRYGTRRGRVSRLETKPEFSDRSEDERGLRKLFGEKPELKAIHAGLECGLLIEKIPDMDVVSIGPQIENAHSPEEKVKISSVQKFYKHLAALLEELA